MFCNFNPKINSQFFMEKPTCHTNIYSKIFGLDGLILIQKSGSFSVYHDVGGHCKSDPNKTYKE